MTINRTKTIPVEIITNYMGALYDPRVTEHVSLNEVRDSLSDGQLRSKMWLVDELINQIGNDLSDKKVAVLGGWVGLLCRMISEFTTPKKILNIELNGNLKLVNMYVNGFNHSQFEFINADMYKVDYSGLGCDVIINTSAEHIQSIKDWLELIPSGKTVIIQSNNYVNCEGHINCVQSVNELINKCTEAKNVKDIIYQGELCLPIYTRYMAILQT